MTDERKDYYSKIADKYDQCAVERIGYRAHIEIPRRLLELYNNKQAHVLDLGCGTGLSADLFFKAGFDVTGIDYSPGMIETARSRPYRELYCQSIEEELPVPDNFFDLVIAIGVWEFVTDPPSLFRSVWQKLRTNGLLAITVPKLSPFAEELGIRTYEPAEFRKFIDPNLFDVVDTMDLFGYESGHFAELLGEYGRPRRRIDYHGMFLKKRDAICST